MKKRLFCQLGAIWLLWTPLGGMAGQHPETGDQNRISQYFRKGITTQQEVGIKWEPGSQATAADKLAAVAFDSGDRQVFGGLKDVILDQSAWVHPCKRLALLPGTAGETAGRRDEERASGQAAECPPVPVPESTTLLLFGLGLIGLAFLIKKKK